jgi:Flp pilus assembly pilin Flp
MQTLISRFVTDVSGVTSIEYGVIASLIAIISAVTTLSGQLSPTFNQLRKQSALNNNADLA